MFGPYVSGAHKHRGSKSLRKSFFSLKIKNSISQFIIHRRDGVRETATEDVNDAAVWDRFKIVHDATSSGDIYNQQRATPSIQLRSEIVHVATPNGDI